VKSKFKVDHIVNILMGVETEEVLSHCHDQLPEFAVGKSNDASYWNAVIRQGIISEYIEKEVENYGLLKVTKSGKKFMASPEPFYFKENVEFGDYEPEAEEGTAVLDDVLLKMLRDLRRKRAQTLNIPPYVIFQDASLESMATMYPITVAELQNIPGVGQGKAQRYGKEFCELIKKHCEENEIERPLDLRVRTVATNSKQKISIIQKVDRKLDLEDIADGLGIEFEELLDEMEAIVYSGTKLDITYYLEDVMDEDYMLDIYDYFHDESETDRLSVAVKILGPDYEEKDIRLVRIKFLSELAN
jgi:ATP-dependent DNA helicase RecQ